jgi:hypothetical protein
MKAGLVLKPRRCTSRLQESTRTRLSHSRRRSFHSSSVSSFLQSSIRCDKVTKSSSVDDASTSAGLRNSLLRAPFQRVVRGGGGALFPWRSSDQLLERLVPGADEFEQKGYLLGGNVVSSNPMFDAYATSYFFIGVPLYQMMFFKQWQEDMAENMSWAFSQGVGGILSNVYHSTYFGV